MQFYFLLFMMRAPITPGTQPQRVRRKMIRTEPHPLSITARGGKKMHSRTRRRPIEIYDLRISICDYKSKNFFTSAYCLPPTALFSEQMISRLQYFQLQVSRIIRVNIQEFLNSCTGPGGTVACKGRGDPASREEDVAGALYLLQHLQ